MTRNKVHDYIKRAVTALACSTLLFSCNDEAVGNGGDSPGMDGGNLRLTAAVENSGEGTTRSEPIRFGNITDGTFYFVFWRTTTKKYRTCEAIFGYFPDYPELANLQLPEFGKGVQWSDFSTSYRNIYLSNVGTSDYAIDNNAYLSMERDISGYDFNAGPYTRENDLLWGENVWPSSMMNKEYIFSVTMHHVMSMVRVEVIVENSEFSDLDLSEATVELTDIAQKTSTFYRLTGEVTLSTKPEDRGPMTLVDYGVFADPGDTPDDSQNIPWANIGGYDPETGQATYLTGDFILPPQIPSDDATRSRIRVKVKDKDGAIRSFSAPIPRLMEMEVANMGTQQTPLRFLREKIMTIRCLITNEPPELIFYPVKVYNWVDVGHNQFTGYETGIYIADQFYQLIKDYSAYSGSGSTEVLEKYGSVSPNGIWRFNIQRSITLEMSKISGMMTPGGNASFQFNLHDSTVTVINGLEKIELRGTEGAETLYEIVTGEYTGN